MPTVTRNRAHLGSSPPPGPTKKSKLFHIPGPSDNDHGASDQVMDGSSATENPTQPVAIATVSSEDVGTSLRDVPETQGDVISDPPDSSSVPLLAPQVAEGDDDKDDNVADGNVAAAVFSEVVGYEDSFRSRHDR